MATRTQQLRQSFLVTGAAAALALVIVLAVVTAHEAGRTLEDLANRRGTEVAIRVASLVTSYLRERRHEAEALAHSPAILVAAQEASQKSAGQGLDRLDVPALERQFSRTRQLGGDPALQRYFREYPQRSDIAALFFTDSHGFTVIASDRTSRFVQSGEEWWQVAVRPAKPLAFGTVGTTPVFGLPGNPVSSLVSFELFARPALRQMMGHRQLHRRRLGPPSGTSGSARWLCSASPWPRWSDSGTG